VTGAGAAIAISLAMRVPAPLKPIADQVIRSASSVAANLAEGYGRIEVRPGDGSLGDLKVKLHRDGHEDSTALRHALKDVPTGSSTGAGTAAPGNRNRLESERKGPPSGCGV